MSRHYELVSAEHLDPEAWDSLDRIVDEFEEAWQVQKAPEIDKFISRCKSTLRLPTLVELIRVDQELSWRCGIRRSVEHYLQQWPSLAQQDSILVELISSECLTRAIFATVPSYRELKQRFPNQCQHVPLARIRSEAKSDRQNFRLLGSRLSRSRKQLPVHVDRTGDRFASLVGTEFQEYRLHRLVERNHAFARFLVTKSGKSSQTMLLSIAPIDPGESDLISRLFRRFWVLQRPPEDHKVGVANGFLYHVAPEDSFRFGTKCGEPVMSLLQDGDVIRDTYEVERELGEGAFAEVYRVRHRFLGRQAMKVFKIVGMTIDETEEMLGEALLLSRIGHPNIVRVFDANTTETSLGICGFFTMEYVAGGSLEKFWKSFGEQFVPVETAVEVITQACRGLALAHRETPPIVHRDIKPQNILVGYEADGLRARLSTVREISVVQLRVFV